MDHVVCPHCQATLKLPPTAGPPMRCPRCRGVIAPTAPSQRPPGTPAAGEEWSWQEPLAVPVEFYAPGVMPALVIVSDAGRRGDVIQAVEVLGYRPLTAVPGVEAGRILQAYPLRMVLLADDGEDQGQAQMALWAHLNRMPIARRRSIFGVRLGAGLKTMDHLQAFALSANLVVNFKDLGDLKAILEHALLEHGQLYGVFREELAAAGR